MTRVFYTVRGLAFERLEERKMVNHLTSRPQAGFSLVELLVALAVSLLVMLAALGSASFYEANRRNTVGGNSALENAMVSTLHIQKDARMAGLGLSGSNGAATCSSINMYFDGTTSNTQAYSSVAITKGSDTTSDTIAFMYSDPIGTVPVSSPICKTPNGTNPTSVCDDTNANGPPAASSEMPVLSTAGFAVGQVALLVPPSSLKPAPDNVALPCTMIGITAVQENSNKIQANPAGGQNCTGASCWNPPNAGPFTKLTGICNDGTTTCNSNSKNIPSGSRLMSIGPMHWVTYSINANNEFQKVEQMGGAAAATSVIAESVVMLRAQYGLSAAANSSAIVKWANAAPDQEKIKAIRIVAIARSTQRVKDKNNAGTCTATTAAPSTGLNFTNGTDDSMTIDLSANADWNCFTYKATSMTIPLKNIVMQTSSPS